MKMENPNENDLTQTRVEVFQGENLPQVQLIKSKLEDAGISCQVENSYMSFLGTPTSNSLKIMVSLAQEKQAFEIIDAYLQSQNLA